MRKFCVQVCLKFALFTFIPLTWAAPVTLVSDPGTYAAPTAFELALATSFIESLPGNPPGGIFNGLRNAPNTLVNPGLDATAPPLVLTTQNWEVVAVPFPAMAHNCPANTPVTITVGQWVAEQTAQTFSSSDTLGLGMAVMDSRNPTISAPVSMALTGSPDDIDIPGPHVVAPVSSVFPFGELQFFSALGGFEVARVVEETMVLQVAQASYSVSTPFSIMLEYDDAACTAIAAQGTQSVPILSPLQIVLLLTLVMFVGVVRLRAH